MELIKWCRAGNLKQFAAKYTSKSHVSKTLIYLIEASKKSQIEIIKHIIKTHGNERIIYIAYGIACSTGKEDVLQYFNDFHRDSINTIDCIHIASEWAAKSNQLHIIDRFINRIKNWNYMLSGACKGGHIHLIELAISKGANEFNMGAYKAAILDKVDIIKYLMTYRKINWPSLLKKILLLPKKPYLTIKLALESDSYCTHMLDDSYTPDLLNHGTNPELVQKSQLYIDKRKTVINIIMKSNFFHDLKNLLCEYISY